MKMYTLTLKDTSNSNNKITKIYIAQTYLLHNVGFSIWTSLKYTSIVVTEEYVAKYYLSVKIKTSSGKTKSQYT